MSKGRYRGKSRSHSDSKVSVGELRWTSGTLEGDLAVVTCGARQPGVDFNMSPGWMDSVQLNDDPSAPSVYIAWCRVSAAMMEEGAPLPTISFSEPTLFASETAVFSGSLVDWTDPVGATLRQYEAAEDSPNPYNVPLATIWAGQAWRHKSIDWVANVPMTGDVGSSQTIGRAAMYHRANAGQGSAGTNWSEDESGLLSGDADSSGMRARWGGNADAGGESPGGTDSYQPGAGSMPATARVSTSTYAVQCLFVPRPADGPPGFGTDPDLSVTQSPGTLTVSARCLLTEYIESYVFDMGDGVVIETQTPAIGHTYAIPGSYTATVVATNSLGPQSTIQPLPVDITPVTPSALWDYEQQPLGCRVLLRSTSELSSEESWSIYDGNILIDGALIEQSAAGVWALNAPGWYWDGPGLCRGLTNATNQYAYQDLPTPDLGARYRARFLVRAYDDGACLVSLAFRTASQLSDWGAEADRELTAADLLVPGDGKWHWLDTGWLDVEPGTNQLRAILRLYGSSSDVGVEWRGAEVIQEGLAGTGGPVGQPFAPIDGTLVHDFVEPGTYTVALTASNSSDTSVLQRDIPVVADPVLPPPLVGAAVFAASWLDTDTGAWQAMGAAVQSANWTTGTASDEGVLSVVAASRMSMKIPDRARRFDPSNGSSPAVSEGFGVGVPVRIRLGYPEELDTFFSGQVEGIDHDLEFATVMASSAIGMLSANRVDQYGTQALIPQTASERIASLLDVAHFPSSQRQIGDDDTALAGQTISGASVWDTMLDGQRSTLQLISSTPDGRIRALAKSAWAQHPSDLLTIGSDPPGSTSALGAIAATLNGSTSSMVNVLTVAMASDQASEQTYIVEPSVERYGRLTAVHSGLMLESASALSDWADFVLGQSSSPTWGVKGLRVYVPDELIPTFSLLSFGSGVRFYDDTHPPAIDVTGRLLGISFECSPGAVFATLGVTAPYPVQTLGSAGSDVIIPDVVGLDKATAESTLSSSGLSYEEIGHYSDTVAVDVVVSQAPEAGREVTLPYSVQMVVSLGRETVSVPDVVGQSWLSADSTLKSAGLVGIKRNDDSPGCDYPNVTSQSPGAGNVVPLGSQVEYFVCVNQDVIVPELIDQPVAEARTRVADAGLRVGAEGSGWSPTIEAGRVMAQQPTSGELVAADTQVDLTVSDGPDPTTITPDFMGMDIQAAQAEAQRLHLVTSTSYVHFWPPQNVVVDQVPLPGEPLPQMGQAVELSVSMGDMLTEPEAARAPTPAAKGRKRKRKSRTPGA